MLNTNRSWGRQIQIGGGVIYNSQVAKPSYKTELRIVTSQTELLTLFFFFFKFFELVTRCEKHFNIVLELVTQDF